MNNIFNIFIDRIKKEQEKKSTYNKYIFNSHLLMFLIISFGAILFNYSSWLEKASILQLKLILFLVLTLMSYFLTTIKIKTFIKEADAIFLLPLENNYKDVMKRIYMPTIILKLFISIAFLSFLYPIIKKLEFSNIVILTFGIMLLTNIVVFTLGIYQLVVYSNVNINNFLFAFFVTYVIGNALFVIHLVNLSILISFLIAYSMKKYITANVNWYGAAEYDSARLEKYYKLVNMFVDVPIDTVKVKRRKYLDIFLPKLTPQNFKKENTYNYYFLRAFLRQENTIFLVFRLFLVAVLFITSLNNIYVSIITIIAFNYLVVIQLLPLYKRLGNILWFSTIPVSENIKVNSFKKVINIILIIFTMLLLIVTIMVGGNIFYLLCSSIFGILVNNYFLNKLK